MDDLILLLLAALLIVFVVRQILVGERSSTTTRGDASTRQWIERNIDQVSLMFPQAPVDRVAYDLSRTHDVSQTVEKLMNNVELPEVPANSPFRGYTRAPADRGPHTGKQSESEVRENLIQRYRLQDRLEEDSQDTSPVSSQNNWSKSRQEREALLQRRKEAAILSARRRMAQKTTVE
ncbi:hypothetical protein PYCC9005_000760 [Savitreella phatthalungensis]